MTSVRWRADICQARIEMGEGNGGRQEDLLARLPVQGQRHVVLVHVVQGLLRNSLSIKTKAKGRLQAPANSSSLTPLLHRRQQHRHPGVAQHRRRDAAVKQLAPKAARPGNEHQHIGPRIGQGLQDAGGQDRVGHLV